MFINNEISYLTNSDKFLDRVKLFFKINTNEESLDLYIEEIKKQTLYESTVRTQIQFMEEGDDKNNLYKLNCKRNRIIDKNISMLKKSLKLKSIFSSNKSKYKNMYNNINTSSDLFNSNKNEKIYSDTTKFAKDTLQHYIDNMEKYKENAEKIAIIEVSKLKDLIKLGFLDRDRLIGLQSNLLYYSNFRAYADKEMCKFFSTYFSTLINEILVS